MRDHKDRKKTWATSPTVSGVVSGTVSGPIVLPPDVERWLVSQGCGPDDLAWIGRAGSMEESTAQDAIRAMGYAQDWRRRHPTRQPPTMLFLALAGNGCLPDQVDKIVEAFKPDALPVEQAEQEIEDLVAGLHPLWVAKQIEYIQRRLLSRRKEPIRDVWAYVLAAFDDRTSHDKWVVEHEGAADHRGRT